jgi:hypothetical protein
MGWSGYQQSRIQMAKWMFIGFLTFLPPWELLSSGQDAAITRSLEQRLEASEQKSAPESGDIVWVSGIVEASPLDLPPRLSEFQNSLIVKERIEEYRRSGKHRHWRTTRENEWLTAKATLGEWQIDNDLIRDGGFVWHRASPCTEYRPASSAWTVKCPGAEYAYDNADDNRRLSYEVTPVTARVVSLIAAVSWNKGVLTTITANDTYQKPFAILVWDEQQPHAMLAKRLHGDWGWMSFWWATTSFIVGVWMFVALRRSRMRSGGELFIGSGWRAVVATSPFLALFAILKTAFFIPAAIGAAVATALIGICLWFPARQYI